MKVLISCQTGTQGVDNGEDSCSQRKKKKRKINKKEKKKQKRENKLLVYSIKGTEFCSCTVVSIESYSTE